MVLGHPVDIAVRFTQTLAPAVSPPTPTSLPHCIVPPSNVAMLQCCDVAMLQCCNVALLQSRLQHITNLNMQIVQYEQFFLPMARPLSPWTGRV
jgi:hypothetical protein